MDDEMEIEIRSTTIRASPRDSDSIEKSKSELAHNSQINAQNTFHAEDDDGTVCPICLEVWTNSGDHRICALKCGHLFGYKCVLRWLDSQSKKTCPTCKKKVNRSDLRFIYAKKLVAVDNMELENIRQQLDDVLKEKNIALHSISRYISREYVLQQEIEQLKKKIQELTLGSRPSDLRLTLQSPISRLRLYMEKNVEVCSKSGCRDCRVFDISVQQDLILVSSRSPTDLFSGFGLKKLSLSTYKPIKFVPLHKDPIRDMSFHSTDHQVVTVSMDKKVKISDLHNSTVLHTVSLDSAAWSCAWGPDYSHELMVGTQSGNVLIFDVRNLQDSRATLNVPGDFSPVVGLTRINADSNTAMTERSFLMAKLNTIWAFETLPDGSFHRHLLPLEGPFLGIRYDTNNRQVLVSSRPNSQTPYARHILCHLEKVIDPEVISCNVLHTFKAGNTAKLLSKTACFVPNNVVAGYHETRKSILMYSINTGEEVGSCPTHDSSVLDIKGFDTSNGKFLVYLNEKKMEFFKFNNNV